MRLDKLTIKAQEALAAARDLADQHTHQEVTPEHLLRALLSQEDGVVPAVLRKLGADAEAIGRKTDQAVGKQPQVRGATAENFMGRRLKELLDEAARQSVEFKDEYISSEHLLLAMLARDVGDASRILREAGVRRDDLLKALFDVRGSQRVTDPEAEGRYQALAKYTRDITDLARKGKLDPVIGRDEEVRRSMQVLSRRTKNNPVLIGEPGVGKTSVVEGLALLAASPGAPAEVGALRIVELMMSALLAETTYRGELEERLEKVFTEVEADPQLIVFIDELHTLVGAGSTKDSPLDVANMLKPALGRGQMRCIGATTIAEYRQYIEKDSALERRFQPVLVKEPTPEETRAILEGLRPSYEAFHRVTITDEALDASIALSIRYLPDRRNPDKARDLIDQAAVNVRVFNLAPGSMAATRIEVAADDVAQVAAEWSGVPLERLNIDERRRLLEMETALAKRVVGQDEAVSALSTVVRTALAGLSHPGRPHGVFLFTGPTGVGKTELAKALAEFLFHSESALVRFDMSELMEDTSVSKLIGAPPGYVGHDDGGQLTDAVRTTPYCVLLFDEIEKAHPDVTGIFLQLFDEGHLTDSKGRRVDFANTVVIMTTNLGADAAGSGHRPIGFEDPSAGSRRGPSPEEEREALLAFFRPELLNRINRVIRFHHLDRTAVRRVIDKLVAQVQSRLQEKDISLDLAPETYEWLMDRGYSRDSGAREMERTIERTIVAPLAEGVIDGRFTPGTTVTVTPADDHLELVGARTASG